MGCEGYHGNLVVQHRRPGVPDEGRGFVAVHLGHLNVHEHEVEPFPGQVFHRFAAIGGGFRKKSSLSRSSRTSSLFTLLSSTTRTEGVFPPFRTECRHGGIFPGWWLSPPESPVFSERMKVKAEPFPGVLSTDRTLPIISTSLLEMDRPRPVPPYFLVRNASPCLKG